MKKTILVVIGALSVCLAVYGQSNSSNDNGSYSVHSIDPGSLASARINITYPGYTALPDELQWLAVQTACLGIYNMAQTGDWALGDPQDYYQPRNIRAYLTGLSGSETKNTMFYGICFNYAQAAYDDISKYRSHYEKMGMKPGGWYIAAAFDSANQIILFDPVSRDRATMTVNGVSVKENSRQNVQTHGGATRHAWLWVYGNDGTIYWIDPTWTDTSGYVNWGVVRNGTEVAMNPAAPLCVVKVNPNGAGFEDFNRGNQSKSKENYDQAIADYTESLRKDSNNAETYYSRGNAYLSKKDYDHAITDYNQAINLDPNYSFAYNNRGIAYRNKGNYDRAITDYNQAINLDPNYSFAYNNRGQAFSDKKDYDRAITDYNQAINLNPNFATAYNNRGVAYKNKGNYDYAIAQYYQATWLDPNDASPHYNLGIAYYDKKDYDRAIAEYTEAIRLNPNYADAYNNRGTAYSNKGNYDRAIADWNKALQINPNHAMARKNLNELGNRGR